MNPDADNAILAGLILYGIFFYGIPIVLFIWTVCRFTRSR